MGIDILLANSDANCGIPSSEQYKRYYQRDARGPAIGHQGNRTVVNEEVSCVIVVGGFAYVNPTHQTKPTEIPSFLQTLDFWDVPPIRRHRTAFEGRQHLIDPEQHIHSPALYAIWGSKSWMLQQIAQENPFDSTIFFWVDTGSWRYVRIPF